MHLSIVKLSRFIRMMDRSPGRRNLAQFVTRANFVRAEPTRVAIVSFDGVNAHEKRTNCTAIEFHGGFLQGFQRRRTLPRDRKDGRLHSYDSRRLHRCDALFGCEQKSKELPIATQMRRVVEMLSRFSQIIISILIFSNNRVSGAMCVVFRK